MTRTRSSSPKSTPASTAARSARQMPKMSDEAPAARGAHELHGAHDDRTLPVRVYDGDGRIMVAAPMPGLEPRDISVAVAGDRVTIHGALRGPRQDERDLSVAEWTIGPYHRDLTLAQPVDGARANATYGNGVLVLALPKAEPGERAGRGRSTRFTLSVLTPTHGARVGHAGRDLRRTTTAAQLNKQRDVAKQAGKSGPVATTKAAAKATTAARSDRAASSGRARRKSTAGPVNV